jgi:hypothetical protein
MKKSESDLLYDCVHIIPLWGIYCDKCHSKYIDMTGATRYDARDNALKAGWKFQRGKALCKKCAK